MAKPLTQPAPSADDANPSPPAPAAPERRHPWRRRGSKVAAVLVVLAAAVIAARVVAPEMIRRYVVQTINRSEGYHGEIGDIDLHLYRGAYTIRDIRVVKTSGDVPVPLFSSPRLDLAVQWDALLAGKVVGRIEAEQPELHFVAGESEEDTQTGAGQPWLAIIEDLFPFRINRLVVHGGKIEFHAFHKDPQVDLALTDLEASVENLSNIHEEVTPLVATIEAKGKAMGQADFEYKMKFDPSAYYPTFEVAIRLLNLDVTRLNDLTQAYGSFDFEKGWFDLVVELDAKGGRVEGYVKPLLRDLQVLSWKDVRRDNPLELVWETLVGLVGEVFKNPPRDQIATVIPIDGDITAPRTDTLAAVIGILRNAFVQAYLPTLQGVAPEAAQVGTGAGPEAGRDGATRGGNQRLENRRGDTPATPRKDTP